MGAIKREGITLVPLAIYFNDRGRAKLELGLAKGKRKADKREPKSSATGSATRRASCGSAIAEPPVRSSASTASNIAGVSLPVLVL